MSANKTEAEILEQMLIDIDESDSFSSRIRSERGRKVFQVSRSINKTLGAKAGIEVDDDGDVIAYVRGDLNLTRAVQSVVNKFMGNT